MGMLNEKKGFKINLIEILIVLVSAYSVAPIVSRFISSYLTTYFYMIVVFLTIALIMVKKGMHSFQQALILIFPFLCWMLLTYFTRTSSLLLWAYQVMLELAPVLIGYYLITYCNRKDKFFPWLIFLLCAVTLITTIVGCIQYPTAARYIATISDSQEALAIQYDWMNIGGYNLVYIIVLLHPLLILAYKQKKIKKIWAFIGSISILALSIYTEYTTAFLLTILTGLLYFFKKELSWKRLLALGVVVVLLFFVFSEAISNFLLYLSEIIESESISTRLEALAGGRVGIENSEDNRIALYEMSLNTFFQNPIFGTFITGGGRIGGHSFILDYIAQFGLIGVVLIVAMYRVIYKKFFAPYKNKKGFGYVYWLFLQAILLSLVNTGMWLIVLAVFTPIFLKAIYPEESV